MEVKKVEKKKDSFSKPSKWLNLAEAIFETIFAIPILGAMVIVGLFWIPMVIALSLHIVALIISKRDGRNTGAPIMGIVANTVGLIPFVGWILHIIAAVKAWNAFGSED